MSDYEDGDDFMDSGDDDFMDEDEDEDTSDAQEDLGFSSVVAEKPKKAYEVDFSVLSVGDIVDAQNREVSHVAGILGLPEERAAVLLRHYRWDKERLIERCMEDRAGVMAAAGIVDEEEEEDGSDGDDGGGNGGDKRRLRPAPGFTCEICCDDGPGKATFAHLCGHRFCHDCYEHYLTQKIKEEGESRNIQCMQTGCNVVVDEKAVGSIVDAAVFARLVVSFFVIHPSRSTLVVPGGIAGCSTDFFPHLRKFCRFRRYKTLLIRTYVDDNDFLRWCPAPGDFRLENCVLFLVSPAPLTLSGIFFFCCLPHSSECEYALECHVSPKFLSTIVPTVVCRCGHRFCFGCGVADHQPCVCVLVKKWLRKCEDDSETANWISANTKECTKCKSTIEKNGGCNHMTCRKCKHEFCWVCMGPWSEHGSNWYNCNRYEEKSSSDARDAQAQSRRSLERYLHVSAALSLFGHVRSAEKSINGLNILKKRFFRKIVVLQPLR
ncbi:MAG: hypothetical protein BJ554DRAFT_6189, partial [Olpidium bornovanus]